jgi:hypothetical protein
VQLRRRELDLDVSDRVRLTLSADAALLGAVTVHRDWLAQETLAVEVRLEDAPGATAQQTKVAGRPLWLDVAVDAGGPERTKDASAA